MIPFCFNPCTCAGGLCIQLWGNYVQLWMFVCTCHWETPTKIFIHLHFDFSLSLSFSLPDKVTYLNTEWLLVIIHTIYRMFNCVNSNRNHSMCALLWICDHLFDSSKMKFTYRGLKWWINDNLERFKLRKNSYRM